MKALMAILVSVCLLTACTPKQVYSHYQLRQLAEELAKDADAMALVTVEESLPSYELGGKIYTDVEVSVMRGQNIKAGEKVILRRHGGTVPSPGASQVRTVTVDYAYQFPKEGGEVFLLLRRVGEKYEVIDAMALQNGQPLMNRPEDQVYLPFLNSLE